MGEPLARVENSATRALHWLLPAAGLITLVGYFGPWIPHRVAGLVVMGLDLGEYVKFLPAIRSGDLHVWREGFYLPLLAVSLAFSLLAFRPRLTYGWFMRIALLAVSAVAALNMLPPAWTPSRMLMPEFQLQATAIGLCLASIAISPVGGLVPSPISGGIVSILAFSAIWFPTRQFLAILPDISPLYHNQQVPGWGLYVTVVGLLCLAGVGIGLIFLPWFKRRPG